MKIILAVFTIYSVALACDNPSFDQNYTLQPGQSQTVQWDFRDCTYGISSFVIYAYRPDKGGYAGKFPSNTPLSITATDFTTGQSFSANSRFFIGFPEKVSGHLIGLSLQNLGKKPLALDIDTTANLGGSP